LALTGGYLDAYTWIVHRAFANAQTANLVFLWVYLTGGEWGEALHYVPPAIRLCVRAMFIAFGVGAAIGAIMTEVTRAYSLAIPVTLLVIVLLLCGLTTAKE
jgi:uncharacterized membrane protein YoaK (UPF0700 family)